MNSFTFDQQKKYELNGLRYLQPIGIQPIRSALMQRLEALSAVTIKSAQTQKAANQPGAYVPPALRARQQQAAAPKPTGRRGGFFD